MNLLERILLILSMILAIYLARYTIYIVGRRKTTEHASESSIFSKV